jgi:predicted acetyltransferase
MESAVLPRLRQLLRLSLERMRDAGQALSGLYTPHDALYARYGWERAEGRKHYELRAKDVRLRLHGRRGHIEEAPADGWQRLDAIYREHSKPRNGPFQRVEAWWRFAVLQHWSEDLALEPSDAVVWVSPEGRDEGYAVYHAITLGMEGRWPARQVYVRDFVSLSGDAYLGLWQHLLAHDLAKSVAIDAPLEDPFPALVEDPWKVGDVAERLQASSPVGRWGRRIRLAAVMPCRRRRRAAWTASRS